MVIYIRNSDGEFEELTIPCSSEGVQLTQEQLQAINEVATLRSTKLDKNQGSDYAGFFLAIDDNGNIVPMEMPSGSNTGTTTGGMTATERSQLQQNTTDISSLKTNKLDKSGYTANKYLGTDSNGNVVEKNAPTPNVNNYTEVVENPYTLPVANNNAIGGVKGATKTSNDTVPVHIDSNGNMYVPTYPANIAVENPYTLPQANANTLGGVKASAKTSDDTIECKIGENGKLYVPTYPIPTNITVDSNLSTTSTNPVQNKVIATKINTYDGILKENAVFGVTGKDSTNKLTTAEFSNVVGVNGYLAFGIIGLDPLEVHEGKSFVGASGINMTDNANRTIYIYPATYLKYYAISTSSIFSYGCINTNNNFSVGYRCTDSTLTTSTRKLYCTNVYYDNVDRIAVEVPSGVVPTAKEYNTVFRRLYENNFHLNIPTSSKFGGIKAAAKSSTDTVECKIGTDGKLYVPAYPEAVSNSGISADVAIALLNCFKEVAWKDNSNKDVYNALATALGQPTI